MKLLITLIVFATLLSACGGGGTTSNNPSTGSSPAKMAVVPIPDDIGLIMQCKECVFVEEQGQRYLAGQVHNQATQAISGYVLSVDLQDAKGTSVRKIDGLMLMDAMVLQAGETKEFKSAVMSNEKNVTQAIVYFKKAGRDVKLSEPLTLKLNAAAATAQPAKAQSAELPKR